MNEVQKIPSGCINWLDNILYRTTEEFAKCAPLANETTNFTGGVSIPANTTRDYYIDLKTVFNQADFLWLAIKTDIFVNVGFVTLQKLIAASTGTPELAGANIIFELNEMSEEEKKAQLAAAEKTTLLCRYTDNCYQSFTESFTASTQYNVQLTGFNGLINNFYVTLWN